MKNILNIREIALKNWHYFKVYMVNRWQTFQNFLHAYLNFIRNQSIDLYWKPSSWFLSMWVWPWSDIGKQSFRMQTYFNDLKLPYCTKNEVFHLLKKSLMENFIFCAVPPVFQCISCQLLLSEHVKRVIRRFLIILIIQI